MVLFCGENGKQGSLKLKLGSLKFPIKEFILLKKTSLIMDSIFNPVDENVHRAIDCPKCHQWLLVRDIENLTYKARERIYDQVYLNYLTSQLKPSERFDKCGACSNYYVIECNERGVFRCYNNTCRFLFCTVCKKRVMSNNELDFKQHQSYCWNIGFNNVNVHSKNIFYFLV